MSYPTSFHTLVLILTSESSRLKLNLLQAVSSWRLRNKSPFYLKCLVLTNQNQLGFQTIVTAMDSQNSEKSKITMSLFYAVFIHPPLKAKNPIDLGLVGGGKEG